MKGLNTKDTVIGKLWNEFSKIFSGQSQPTKKHLFEIILSVLALNGFQSVKYNFEHFIGEISNFKLKSFYYTLNNSKIDLADWLRNLVRLALSVIASTLRQQPIILSIDDTMVEKSGTHFEKRSRLFDHARHNGSNYLDGHCFVSLVLSVPVCDRSGCRYLSFPLCYRMWTKETSKLEMAAELVRTVMSVLGKKRMVILCCDSWYPKGAVKSLVHEFENLELICNVRSDTVLYALPPKKNGKRGRPRVRGERLSLQQFPLKEIPGTTLSAGCQTVLTMLWDKRPVHAIVTKSAGGSYRLFLCTCAPGRIFFNLDFVQNQTALSCAKANPGLLPLAIYSFRWNIEVAYYEQKSFWALEDYMLRSKTGIERLLNLLSLIYSMMKLLPFVSTDFSALKSLSPQRARSLLGNFVRQQVFLSSFACYCKPDFIRSSLLPFLNDQLLSLTLPA